jgi:hypothetical protein
VSTHGNPALADAYLAAYAHHMQALQQLAKLIAPSWAQERALTEPEQAHVDVAQAASDEAEEQFERVWAAVSAFLKDLDEKGGV